MKLFNIKARCVCKNNSLTISSANVEAAGCPAHLSSESMCHAVGQLGELVSAVCVLFNTHGSRGSAMPRFAKFVLIMILHRHISNISELNSFSPHLSSTFILVWKFL